MFKALFFMVAVFSVSSRIASLGQGLDELNEEADENSRLASARGFGAAVPKLRPSQGMIRPHECYVCTDCPKVLANTTYKGCSYTADITKNNKCVVYSERYKHMDKPWYVRGCASERGTCEDIKRAHLGHEDVLKLNFCYECDGEKCNVNDGIQHHSNLATFFVLVVTPLLAKQTLS